MQSGIIWFQLSKKKLSEMSQFALCIQQSDKKNRAYVDWMQWPYHHHNNLNTEIWSEDISNSSWLVMICLLEVKKCFRNQILLLFYWGRGGGGPFWWSLVTSLTPNTTARLSCKVCHLSHDILPTWNYGAEQNVKKLVFPSFLLHTVSLGDGDKWQQRKKRCFSDFPETNKVLQSIRWLRVCTCMLG